MSDVPEPHTGWTFVTTNTYRIEPGKILRHPAEAGLTVASLLSLLVRDEAGRGTPHDGYRRDGAV